jgi:hypothetical protein
VVAGLGDLDFGVDMTREIRTQRDEYLEHVNAVIDADEATVTRFTEDVRERLAAGLFVF